MMRSLGEAARQTTGIRAPLVFAAMFAAYLIWAGLPASLWLDVKSVRVADVAAGQQPLMQVNRSINRAFEGRWRVELEREYAPGLFGVVQIARGDNNYNPDATLPDPLTMDWWTYPSEFRFLPGRYRIETCWRIDLQVLLDRRKCIMSNVFTVK